MTYTPFQKPCRERFLSFPPNVYILYISILLLSNDNIYSYEDIQNRRVYILSILILIMVTKIRNKKKILLLVDEIRGCIVDDCPYIANRLIIKLLIRNEKDCETITKRKKVSI